jgi:hypothetical protein
MRRQPETAGAAFVRLGGTGGKTRRGRSAAGATTCYYPRVSASFPEVNRSIT